MFEVLSKTFVDSTVRRTTVSMGTFRTLSGALNWVRDEALVLEEGEEITIRATTLQQQVYGE